MSEFKTEFGMKYYYYYDDKGALVVESENGSITKGSPEIMMEFIKQVKAEKK